MSLKKTNHPVSSDKFQTATFAAGCFWGVEEALRSLPGVLKTTVGYAGGHTKNPTYWEVATGGTGHAEAVKVEFDPAKISYEELLDAFWMCHNPTVAYPPDVGKYSEYRSAIFFHTPEQKRLAEASKKKHQEMHFMRQITTQIVPAKTFWPAEDYHQQYLAKRGMKTCHF